MKLLWLCLLLAACAANPAPQPLEPPEQVPAPVTEAKPAPSPDAENSKKLNESITRTKKSIQDFRDKQKHQQ